MAGYQWLMKHRQIALHDVQVCAAHATCKHAQQHEARRYLRARHIFDTQIKSGGPYCWIEDGSFHERSSFSLKSDTCSLPLLSNRALRFAFRRPGICGRYYSTLTKRGFHGLTQRDDCVLADSPVTEDDHTSSECHDRQGDLNWLCNWEQHCLPNLHRLDSVCLLGMKLSNSYRFY
jgi:hypothetical protein